METRELFGTDIGGSELIDALEYNELVGFEFVENHHDWGGADEIALRERGPIVKRVSDGTFWWVSYEFDSYDTYYDYMEATEVHQVTKVVWDTK